MIYACSLQKENIAVMQSLGWCVSLLKICILCTICLILNIKLPYYWTSLTEKNVRLQNTEGIVSDISLKKYYIKKYLALNFRQKSCSFTRAS